MTDKELRRLRFLPRERERLKKELEEARLEYAGCRTHSVVMGSRASEPYDLHAITVSAPGWDGNAQAALGRVRDAERQLRECEEELVRLNAYIDSIEDKQLRTMFHMHYRRHKTWQQVSMHFGRQSEFWARNLAKKYMGNIENIDFDAL